MCPCTIATHSPRQPPYGRINYEHPYYMHSVASVECFSNPCAYPLMVILLNK